MNTKFLKTFQNILTAFLIALQFTNTWKLFLSFFLIIKADIFFWKVREQLSSNAQHVCHKAEGEHICKLPHF